MKYQYLTAEAASIILFPISYEYTLEAVSNPTTASNMWWPMLLSIVEGITMIPVSTYYSKK